MLLEDVSGKSRIAFCQKPLGDSANFWRLVFHLVTIFQIVYFWQIDTRDDGWKDVCERLQT